MAVFNAAADAVMASVGVQRAAERLALGVRVGVSTGDVTEDNGDYFGPAVVEAKRLCDAAHPSRNCRRRRCARPRRLARKLRVQRARAVRAEGVSGSTHCARGELVAGRAAAAPPQVGAAVARPLIGRGDELTAALNALTEGSNVVVAGEPGIGKTRLVAELATRMAGARAEVLYGRCEEQPVAPYEPWIEALNLRSPFDLAPDRATGDPEESRLEFFESVRARLCGASGRNRVFCVLEDVQWADRPSLLLLRFLLRPPTDPQVLFALTYRESEVGRRHPFGVVLADLHRDAATCRITFRGLQLAETRALVAQTSGHAQSEPFMAAVQRETEGNPFFVQQVVANLLETGSSVERFSLPESVREVVGRRLARLSDETNRLLAIAAVVGREFDLELVAHVLPIATFASVLDCVDEACATGVVVEQLDSFDRFTFGHALIRATLLEEFSTAPFACVCIATLPRRSRQSMQTISTSTVRHSRTTGPKQRQPAIPSERFHTSSQVPSNDGSTLRGRKPSSIAGRRSPCSTA